MTSLNNSIASLTAAPRDVSYYEAEHITNDDIDAVVNALRAGSRSSAVPQFELSIAALCGANHAVAVNSAASALHVACRALNLGPGDWLWTSPITFITSANCGLLCGAEIDFVDIDPQTYNMCPVALAHKLEAAERAGCLPKIVVLVHFAGQSCDMAAIQALSRRYGFRIIEDASHALGGSYQNAPVGSCRHCDITVVSFDPDIRFTTGEGGMALTNSASLASRMACLSSNGVTRNPASAAGQSVVGQSNTAELYEAHSPEPRSPEDWSYQQVDLGHSYAMTAVHAALGRNQIGRLNGAIARRRELAGRYDQAFDALPVQLPYQSPNSHSAMYLYPIVLDTKLHNRQQVFGLLRQQGVAADVHYMPVYSQPHYRAMGFAPSDYPEAERYFAGALSLPIDATLSDIQQDHIISAILAALQ